jgi:osmotically-inducible protein OsmY
MALKNEITQELQRIRGVKRVYNELVFANSISVLTQTSDSVITGKVKSNLYNHSSVPASSIKVVTEDSTVYLLGKVFKSVAGLAAQLAKVDGTKKVVLLFEYLD